MEASEISLILGGLGALIATLVTAYRGLAGDKFKHKTTESENILSGYTGQIKVMREELKEAREAHRSDVAAIRTAHAEEMARLTAHHRTELENTNWLHEQDRQEWIQEKAELRSEIEMLKAQLVALLARIDNSLPFQTRQEPPTT